MHRAPHSREKNEKAKQKVADLYYSFCKHYKAMQAEWLALETDDNVQAFKDAGVLGAYRKLGDIVDEEKPGSMMKKFEKANHLFGGTLRLPWNFAFQRRRRSRGH